MTLLTARPESRVVFDGGIQVMATSVECERFLVSSRKGGMCESRPYLRSCSIWIGRDSL